MSIIKLDVLSWVPEEARTQILDAVVEFVSRQAEKVLGEQVSEVISKLKSDSGFKDAFNEGLKQSTERFIQEYIKEDEDLVTAIAGNREFWQAKSVRQALLGMIQRPGHSLDKDRETLVRHFDDVLPKRLNRERVDRAVTFFLRCLAEEVWHLPQLHPIYELQLQRITAERATEMVRELQKMRADVREALLALVQGMAEQQKVQDTTTPGKLPKPPNVYHNLPWPNYVSFIGRQKELDSIRELLSPANRAWIIVIDGIGGIGKSSLALEVAHRYLREHDELPQGERFQAIVWTSAQAATLSVEGVVPRQKVTRTLEDIYTTISLTLDREDITRAGSQKQYELIRQALTRQRTLLIIDNLEAIDDERVNAFLWELPAPTKCIVTTRYRIDIAYPIRLTGMPRKDGLTMIAQECAKKNVKLTEAQSEKLYDRTGGVPLAIVWSIAQIAYGGGVDVVLSRLGEPSEDITRFCFEGTLRHIRGTDAHKLLMSLSLFATDASPEALGYVAGFGADVLSRDEGLVHLEKLSLINRYQGRLSLLPLTKEWVLAQLQAKAEFQHEALERFIKYYVDLVDSYPRSDFSSHPMFQIELANILHLLDLCRSRGRDEVVAQIMMGIDVFLFARGHWNKALDSLTTMLTYAKEKSDSALQAHANRALGRIYFNNREYDSARVHLEEAYQQYKHVGNIEEALSSANYLSLVYAETGNLVQARRLVEDNLKLALSEKNYDLIIRLQNTLAELDIEEGNLTKARERVQSVLGLEETESATSTVGIGLTYLIAGKLAMHDKDFASAHGFFERSLTIAYDRGIEQDKGSATMWIANLLRAEGKIEEAVETAQHAFEIFFRIGDIRGADEARWLVSTISDGWQAPMLKRWTRKV